LNASFLREPFLVESILCFLMPYAVSDSIRLYGTNEPVEPPRILQAGPLTVEFEAGNLRYIRFRGHEMIRAVSFVVRDKNWGTYAPQITNLVFHEEPDSFRISYEATVGGKEQAFRYSAVIAGKFNGSLSFSGKGTASSDFLTNRTGFVVLHPIEGVAGAPCTVEHLDGTIEETRFPLLIDPVQPMSALQAISHEFLPGLKVTCRMEGDIFEMEDQRNWTDASYKTYVRPLALPWPYVIAKSDAVDQTVTLTVSGSITEIESVDSRARLTIGARRTANSMPRLGFGLDPKDIVVTAVLTASEFELATQDYSAMNSLERGFADKQLILAPYAVARLRSRRR
jgi:D-apionolactonase